MNDLQSPGDLFIKICLIHGEYFCSAITLKKSCYSTNEDGNRDVTCRYIILT